MALRTTTIYCSTMEEHLSSCLMSYLVATVVLIHARYAELPFRRSTHWWVYGCNTRHLFRLLWWQGFFLFFFSFWTSVACSSSSVPYLFFLLFGGVSLTSPSLVLFFMFFLSLLYFLFFFLFYHFVFFFSFAYSHRFLFHVCKYMFSFTHTLTLSEITG